MSLHSGTAIFEVCKHGSHHVIPLHLEVAENPNFFGLQKNRYFEMGFYFELARFGGGISVIVKNVLND